MRILEELRNSSECESEIDGGIELKSTISVLNSLIDDYKKYEENKAQQEVQNE